MKKILASGIIFAILVIPLINAITPMAEADTNNVALTDMAILTALGLGGVALTAGQDGLAMTAQNAIDDIRANAPGVVSAIQSSINEANNTMILSATGVWAVLANYIGASYDVGEQSRSYIQNKPISSTSEIFSGVKFSVPVTITDIGPYSSWGRTYALAFPNGSSYYVCASVGDVQTNLLNYQSGNIYTVVGNSNQYCYLYRSPAYVGGTSNYVTSRSEIWDACVGQTITKQVTTNYGYSGASATAVDQGAEFNLGGNISADSGVVVTIPQSIDQLQGLTWQQILEQQQVIEADTAQAWANARVAEIEVVNGKISPWPLPIDWPIGYSGEWSIPQTISADGTITADTTIGLTLTGAQTITASTTVTATGTIDPPASEINWDKLKMTGLLFTNKFPFSLPWDLFESFNSFNTGPGSDDHQVFTFDLSNTPLQQSFSVNMEWFEEYIPIIKMVELAIFDIGLILGTRKLLGGDA